MKKKLPFIADILKSTSVVLITFILLGVSSCTKKQKDPNELGGETDIALTQVGTTSTTSIVVDGQTVSGPSIVVTNNNNGLVTYRTAVSLNSLPDSIAGKLTTIMAALYDFYNPQNLVWSLSGDTVIAEFTIKVTSEGIQDFFTEGRPWTIAKYGDDVGTSYSIETDNGETRTRTVTEKTGQDDWPHGFFYIKTSKIEQDCSPDNPELSKIIYRVNHNFGLVYVEVISKSGKTAKMHIFT